MNYHFLLQASLSLPISPSLFLLHNSNFKIPNSTLLCPFLLGKPPPQGHRKWLAFPHRSISLSARRICIVGTEDASSPPTGIAQLRHRGSSIHRCVGFSKVRAVVSTLLSLMSPLAAHGEPHSRRSFFRDGGSPLVSPRRSAAPRDYRGSPRHRGVSQSLGESSVDVAPPTAISF